MSMDFQEFRNRMNKLSVLLPTWLKPFGEQAIIMLQGRIGEGMIDNPNPTYPTGLEELQNVTGTLFRSFMIGQPYTLSEVEADAHTGLKIFFGSEVPYAAIHEYGGETEEGWKIPARQYFSKGVNRFMQKDYEKLKKEIIMTIVSKIKKLYLNG